MASGNSRFASVNQKCCLLYSSVQLPTVPDHVWYKILSHMAFEDFARLSCVSSSLTVVGSEWALLRSLTAWSAKVRTLWQDITQIRATVNKHRRAARDTWRSDGTLTYSVHIKTLNELASHCDMARGRASRIAKIIKPLKQSFYRLCGELESVLSQHPQSDWRLVAFEIDIEEVRKSYQAQGSECRYDFAAEYHSEDDFHSDEEYDSDMS